MNTLPRTWGPNLKNLRAEGLSAGMPIRQWGKHNRYRVFFIIIRPSQRYKMKELAMGFLDREFEAKEFEFFVSKEDPDRAFYCEFTSFAVEGI